MRSTAIVDAGPLIASLDKSDADHAACRSVLRRHDLHLILPALVVAEVAYIAGKRFGASVEAAFIRGLDVLEVESPSVEEWPVMAGLMERYADFPLGAADASIVVLADRLETDLIVTLDRRHFGTVRSPQGRRFRLLPEVISVHEEVAAYETGPA